MNFEIEHANNGRGVYIFYSYLFQLGRCSIKNYTQNWAFIRPRVKVLLAMGRSIEFSSLFITERDEYML